jgi:hypothetical protein
MPEEDTHLQREHSQEISHDVRRHDSLDSTTLTPKEASQAAPFPSLLNMANAAPSSYTSQTWPTTQTIPPVLDQHGLTNSTYIDPGSFGASDSFLPQVPMYATDPNYWGNFDFNGADVFESAAWENLIGSTEPDMFNWTFRA